MIMKRKQPGYKLKLKLKLVVVEVAVEELHLVLVLEEAINRNVACILVEAVLVADQGAEDRYPLTP
jgi:hypothetical protein